MPKKALEDSVAQIAEEAFPGWKPVRETSLEEPSARSAKFSSDDVHDEPDADAVMPSIEELRTKYFGADSATTELARAPDPDAPTDIGDVSLVEFESGPLKKTAAVSKSKKKVLWSQG
jgi:hypothetical protein